MVTANHSGACVYTGADWDAVGATNLHDHHVANPFMCPKCALERQTI